MEYNYYDTTFFFFFSLSCYISILLHTALAFGTLRLLSLLLQKDAYLSSELSFVGSGTFFSGVLTNIYSSLSNVQYCYSMTWFSLHLSDT